MFTKAFAYYQVYDPWDGVNFPSKPIIWLKKREFGLPII